jgi:hypothetical protein
MALGEPIQLLHQQAEEQSHVRHHASGFQGAPVRQLGHNCRVDIDADHLDASGGHITDANGVQHRGEHEDHVAALHQTSVVGWASIRSILVSGRGPSSRMEPAREKGTLFFTHSYITPASQDPLLDGVGNAAMATDGVDGPQVVAVPTPHRGALLHIYTEGGAQQGLLDIVDCDRIPPQQSLYIALPNQAETGVRRRRYGSPRGQPQPRRDLPDLADGAVPRPPVQLPIPPRRSLETPEPMKLNSS